MSKKIYKIPNFIFYIIKYTFEQIFSKIKPEIINYSIKNTVILPTPSLLILLKLDLIAFELENMKT